MTPPSLVRTVLLGRCLDGRVTRDFTSAVGGQLYSSQVANGDSPPFDIEVCVDNDCKTVMLEGGISSVGLTTHYPAITQAGGFSRPDASRPDQIPDPLHEKTQQRVLGFWRRGPDSNRRMTVLQTVA